MPGRGVGALILVVKLRWISLRLAVALTGTALMLLHCLAVEEVPGPTVEPDGRPDPTLLPVAALQTPN
ncbi:MAG TPA: hypothetical protein VEQ67_15795, partial [Mycobacterium sp.]|nr:hypothetical protein [Mycobacterium sp.]